MPKGKRCLSAFLFLCILCCWLVLPTAAASAADSGPYQRMINKTYRFDENYQPDNLVYLSHYARASASVRMEATAATAFGEMLNAAKAAGVTNVYGASGYRSYSLQTTLYRNKCNYYRGLGYGQEEAQQLAATVVAPPGASEHQSGLAIDVLTGENGSSMTESFANTKAGVWLNRNCWRYGYILRYPASKEAITGYIYEPWHFRYVGRPVAEYIMQHGLCLEEFYHLMQLRQMLEFTAANGRRYMFYYTETGDCTPPGRLISQSQTMAGAAACLTVTAPLTGKKPGSGRVAPCLQNVFAAKLFPFCPELWDYLSKQNLV